VISSLLERWHQRAQAHQHLTVRQLKQREREREGFRCPTKSTEPGKRLAAVDSEIKACCTEGPTELTTPQNLIQSVVGLVQDISLL